MKCCLYFLSVRMQVIVEIDKCFYPAPFDSAQGASIISINIKVSYMGHSEYINNRTSYKPSKTI